MTNLERYLKKVEEIKNTGGVKLHLGCGPRVLDGFINIDKYVINENIVNEDIFNMSFPDNYANLIYSSHSLEHLPIRHARLALKNWFKILKPGGKLFLAIPDLEEIMKALLNKSIPFASRYFWYLHTLFGYQTDSNNLNPKLDSPLDLGQFHTCGFTDELITLYLNEDGYKVDELYKYDGWKTPSMFIEATKPNKTL